MQGKKLLFTAMASLIVLSAAAPTYAIMSIPNGWYIEGNAGSSHLSGKSYPGSATKSGFAGNANVGYKLMPYFGLEAGYSLYASTNIKNSAGVKAATDKHYSFDLAGKGIFPVSDTGFEIFAKLGAMRASSTVSVNNDAAAAALGIGRNSHSAIGLYAGLGLQYYVMPELALVAQWQRAQGDSSTGTFDLYSGGISFIVS
jgi:hypothetical protein